jgi:hypothetical protein
LLPISGVWSCAVATIAEIISACLWWSRELRRRLLTTRFAAGWLRLPRGIELHRVDESDGVGGILGVGEMLVELDLPHPRSVKPIPTEDARRPKKDGAHIRQQLSDRHSVSLTKGL